MTRVELKLDGKNIEFSFGLGYLGELLDETGKTLDEIVEAMRRNPFKTVPLMMHISAKYASESRGRDFDLTFSDFVELLENEGGINSDFAERFLKEFKKHITGGKNVPKDTSGGEGETQKKR